MAYVKILVDYQWTKAWTTLEKSWDTWKLGEINVSKETIVSRPDIFQVVAEDSDFQDSDVAKLLTWNWVSIFSWKPQ